MGAYPTCPTQPDPLPYAPGTLQSLQTPALSSPGVESLHLAGDAAAPSAAHQPVPLTGAHSCGFVGCLVARASGDTRWHRPAAAPLPAPLSCSTLHSAKGPALPSRGKRGARSERIYPRPSLRCNSRLLPADPCTLLLPGVGTTLLSSCLKPPGQCPSSPNPHPLKLTGKATADTVEKPPGSRTSGHCLLTLQPATSAWAHSPAHSARGCRGRKGSSKTRQNHRNGGKAAPLLLLPQQDLPKSWVLARWQCHPTAGPCPWARSLCPPREVVSSSRWSRGSLTAPCPLQPRL